MQLTENSHYSKKRKRKFRTTLVEVVTQKIEPFHEEKDETCQRSPSILPNQYIQCFNITNTFTTFLVFHLVNFLLSNITGFSLFTRHSVDQVSASSLTSPFCHSPTQPQLELELDLIMGRKPPPHHHQELLRHFQAT